MSRFFAGGSESESESSSEEEEVQVTQKATAVAVKAYPASDDEEEAAKRIVRSEKDKRFDDMTAVIKQLRNHKKIRDMANVLNDFESLTKAYEKAKKVVDKEGVPRFYVRCLVELDDFVNEVWEDREGRKTMSKNNAKGLTTLRQKLKKYNRDFDSDIVAYRENPDEGTAGAAEEAGGDDDEADGFVDSGDDDDSQSDDDDEIILPTASAFQKPALGKEVKAARNDEDDESDDSIDWDASDDDESDSDDGMYADNPALRFLKKESAAGDEFTVKRSGKDSKRAERAERKVGKDRRDEAGSDEEDQEWKEVKGGVVTTGERPKMFAKDQEINHDAVFKKLMEVVAVRGKKSTDRSGQIDLLTELREVTIANKLGPAMEAKILFHTVAAVFDYNPNIAACMTSDIWFNCLKFIKQLIEILFNNSSITVSENVPEDNENFVTEPYRLRGCVFTMVERMDEEFTKMLQGCDAHSTEYVDRLRDERAVCNIIDELEQYALKRSSTADEMCRVYMLKIKHIYYKFDTKIGDVAASSSGTSNAEGVALSESGNSLEAMSRLCQYIYAKDSTDRIRTQAILCHIYHLALHDRWFEARDLMLMSHLQDCIQQSDVPTQIVYNRTMVQLGLCAFRQGMIKDAHNCLVDIQSSGRAKELLAQGLLLQRQHERTAEQEKIEKRRQMPYHMHINLELLECVYLVSAMLMEIPYMAAHELDARRRMISKNFHHVLRISERQPLVGPPESMREHVVQASKAMKRGEWKACRDYLVNEKMNSKVWSLFHKSDLVRTMIEQKIQEESLRTYLFTYSSVYDSLSLVTLAHMFELDQTVIHSVVSKMIINEELMASLDEPTQTVAMHRTEPSRLQSLALQLSEKVAALVDNNERIMEMKQGNFFFQRQGDRQGGYHQRDHQGGERGHYQGGGERGHYQGGGERGHHQGGGERGHYQGGERNHYQGGERGHYQGGERNHYQGGERSHYQGGERSHYQGGERSHYQGGERGHYQGGRERSHYQGGGERSHYQGGGERSHYQGGSGGGGGQQGWGRQQNRPAKAY